MRYLGPLVATDSSELLCSAGKGHKVPMYLPHGGFRRRELSKCGGLSVS